MNHFRTAVLTVILAGGTLVSYATAYTVMDWTADKAQVSAQGSVTPAIAARGRAPIRVDVSDREIAGTLRPVRVIDLASGAAGDARS